jgi:FlaA1/EpsC-like NDP-sugar epimerase
MKNIKKLFSFLRTRLLVVFFDLLMIPLSWYGAYWLRFNLGLIPEREILNAAYLLPFLIFVQMFSFWFFGLYRGIWRFASLPDFIRIIKAVFVGVLVSVIIIFFLPFNIPRSIILIYAWLLVSLLSGARLMYRWFSNYRNKNAQGKRVLMVGAGQAADLLLREFNKDSSGHIYNVVVIADQDPTKLGCDLHGVRVAGNLDQIPKLIKKFDIDFVIIAMPSVEAGIIRKVIADCKDAKVEFLIVPRFSDLITGYSAVNTLRKVSLEDLLGRDPVNLDWENIDKTIHGKKILVSGGGGSIGSELCRQIARLKPSLLSIIDNSEFNLYSIDRELREKFPGLQLVTKLIDVTDAVAISGIMVKYKPELVFHAAAYKHVPLLEYQIRAAIRNNVIGTRNIAEAAAQNGVANFVLISTDKAVYPTNIMGTTKRAGEIFCQNYNGRAGTRFVTVRFGNVLGSAGSVVPLFKAQLEAGQDLTVTHPEVTRYFMTIPEATQLILQAMTIGQGGEIFVLDMGSPIKIKTLAEQLIYLSGKKLGLDVNIVYTGLRPGEKLHEELFLDAEKLVPTQHQQIMQAQHLTWDWQRLNEIISTMQRICEADGDKNVELRKLLCELVPEYRQPETLLD